LVFNKSEDGVLNDEADEASIGKEVFGFGDKSNKVDEENGYNGFNKKKI